MARITYRKLIRDRIPQIIEGAGKHYAVRKMDDEAYRQALRAKLIEEAKEVQHANKTELMMELADLLEVIDSIITANGLRFEDVRAVQGLRHEQHGGFDKQLELLWVDEPD